MNEDNYLKNNEITQCRICKIFFKSLSGLGKHISNRHKISTQKYYIQFIHKTNGICKVCKKPTKFINMNSGFSQYCSSKCYANDPGRISKFKNPEILEKIKQTNLRKYGFDNPFKSKNIQEKIKQTNLRKYGFENCSLSEKIKEKAIEEFKSLIEELTELYVK